VTLRASRYTAERARATQPPNAEREAALRDVEFIDAAKSSSIDLGDRTIRVVPRNGHTDSDVTLELQDPAIVFCGDLVWNGMFPNYVNASPTALATAVRALPRGSDVRYVPGHGPMAREADVDRYVAVLDEVEHAARSAYVAGVPLERAGADFRLPPSLGEWVLFNAEFFPRAFAAWYRDLDRQRGIGRDASAGSALPR
jgi:glyoxylase-like metal-dependent hydrolase (beta-lactamase superfamily II)